MKLLRHFFLVTAILILLTGFVRAQEAMWKELNEKIKVLFAQEQYSEALKLAEEAVKVAENTTITTC